MDPLYSYYAARAHDLTTLVVAGPKVITREGIHRLKVTMKKLKALFKLLEYLDKDFHSKHNSNQIKPLFTASGKVRDLDIAISLLGNIASERILAQLQTSQKEKVHALRELLSGLKVDALLPTDEVTSICASSVNNIEHVSMFLSLAGHQISGDFSGKLKKNELHDMRKRLKEFLYITEILHAMQLGEKSLSQLLPEIEIIQRKLGKWHDIVITIEEVKKLSGGKQADVIELNAFLKELEKRERAAVIESISKSEIFSFLTHLQ